jgi:hypothetical protein
VRFDLTDMGVRVMGELVHVRERVRIRLAGASPLFQLKSSKKIDASVGRIRVARSPFWHHILPTVISV